MPQIEYLSDDNNCNLQGLHVNTTQRLAKTTLIRVKKHGTMGESFDSALSRLLDRIEQGEQDSV